jgi:flagellar L-ring protein precursor FlgH
MKRPFAICLLIPLLGCAGQWQDIGKEPAMSPVGSGLSTQGVGDITSRFPDGPRAPMTSLWDPTRSDFFRDPRATRSGDVVTVNIAINDKATFGNTTDRSLNSQITNSNDFSFNLINPIISGKNSFNAASNSAATGKGSIDRAEKIQLQIAAVVTRVLPNGNLLISGSQEVRVNYELRLLEIAGIVRPRDIGKDNTISYDKIAEARISYGGHGRLSEVQQPGVGQQIYDIARPY